MKYARISVRFSGQKYHVYAGQSESKTDPAELWIHRYDSVEAATKAISQLERQYA